MKKIVQRFALMALMLLPMLAYATVPTPTVNYPVRGTVTVVTDEDVDYDIVRAVANTGYQLDATPWDLTGASIDGTNIKTVGTNELWVLKTYEALTALRVKFAPTTPTLTVTTPVNGTVTDGDDNPLLGSYAYGSHIVVKATGNTNYVFYNAVWDMTDDPYTNLGSYDEENGLFDFYITENTTLTVTFIGATYTLTIASAPDNNANFKVGGSAYTAPVDVPYAADPNIAITIASEPTHYSGYTWVYEVDGSPVQSGDQNSPLIEWGDYTVHTIGPNAIFTVNYTPENHTITVVSDDDVAGTVTGSGTYGWGTTQTITATPTDTAIYAFSHWNDGNEDATRTITVDGDATYTAYFDNAKFPITLAMSAGADGSFSYQVDPETSEWTDYAGTEEFYYSAVLRIRANDGTNYTFTQWSDGVTDNPREVQVWNATNVNLTAEYTTVQYAVSFADNGYAGKLTLTGNTDYDYNTDATVTAAEVDADAYTFAGWQVGGSTVSTDASYTFTVTEAVELTALYEGVEYTINAVSANDAEGTVSPATQSVTFGETFSLTATPNEGYAFKHWNEPTHYGDVAVVTDPLDFSNAGHEYTWTASFGPVPVNIAIADPDPAYGITITTASPIATAYNATVAEPEYTNADASMYVITGWKDASDNDIVFPYTVNVTSDIEIHAVIEGAEHNLTLTNATYGDETSATLRYGTTFTLTPATIAGKSFKNWQVNGVDGSTDASYEFTMTNADMAIEAIYQDVVYTVTATAVPAGAATFTGTGTDFTYGATATIVVDMDEHYTFDSWEDDNTAAMTPRVITVTEDVDLQANFTANTYPIAVAVNDALMGSATCDVTELAYGEAMNTHLTVVENAGYYLKEWRTAEDVVVTVSDMLTWTYDGTATLTAVFDYEDITVTTEALDSAAIADLSANAPVVDGNRYVGGIVTTTAQDITGWHFKNWENGSTDNPRVDTLTAVPPTFSATYGRNVYTVTLNVDEEKGENVSGDGEYRFEDIVTLAVDAKYGYTFTGWKDAEDNDVVSGFSIDADMVLTAQFTTNQYTVTPVADANGSVTPDVATSVDYNTTITLTATPDFGYTLTKWENDVDDVEYTTNAISPVVTEDVTWTASFELYDFNIIVNVPADVDDEVMGTVEVTGDKKLGGTFTLTPTANPGYEFVKFTGEETSTDYASAPYNFSVTVDGDDTTFTAVFQRAEFTVAADVNDALMGTVAPASTDAAYKTAVTLTATPEAGYEVENWTNDVDATTLEGSNSIEVTVPAQNITWTANFIPSTYTISAVANGAEMGTATVNGETETTAAFGSTITLAYTANEGYAFDNWTDPDDNVIADPTSVTVPVDGGTYTANFHAEQYNINLLANFDARGTVVFDDDLTSTKLATFGQSYAITATPAYGYVFTGWSDGQEGTNLTRTVTLPTAADFTLTANFDYMPYTVTVNYSTDSADVTVNGVAYTEPVEIQYTQVASIEVTPKEHFHIVNGNSPYTNASPLSFDTTVLSNIVFNYTFVPDTHAVNIVANNATWGHIEGVSETEYAYGTVLTGVTAVPEGDFSHFVDWSDAETAPVHSDITVNADIDLTANFAVNQYDVNVAVAADNTGMGTVDGNATGIDHGTSVTITAIPATGYQFVNWTNDDDNDAEVSTDASYTFELTGNVNYTAHFDYKTYTMAITVPVKEMGYVEVRDENDEVLGADSLNFSVTGLKTHTEYTVVATPKYGYNFVNWSGDNTGTDSLFTVNNDDNTDVAYTANFGFNQYTITLTANSDARGTLTGAGTYSYGNVISISATPETGFNFVRWDDGNTTNPRDIIIREDAAYQAVFAYDPINIVMDECDSVNWTDANSSFDTMIFASGVYTHVFVDVLGEDSVVNNTVTVRLSTTGTDVQTSCYTAYTWIDGIEYTESNNEATFLLTNAAGCDSLVTLDFTYYEDRSKDTTVEACNPFYWDYTDMTYDTEGDFVIPAAADMNGCDSTTTLHLTFTTPKDTTLTTVACDEFDWEIAGETHHYTATTDDSFVFTDVNQCTATATLHLTINTLDDVEETASACDSYTWTIASTGETFDYTEGGDKTETITDPVTGCTATATLHLTINHNSSTVFEDVVACDTYEMTWTDSEIETITASNTYTHDYTSVEGCPSTDQVTVTINSSTTGVEDTTVCDTYTWINGETYTESVSGVEYTIAGGNAVACDSTVTLNLTVNYKVEELVEEAACVSYNWNGLTLTNSGDYTMNDNGGAANGCDSITTLRLTINQPQEVTLPAVTACDSYEFNGETYTESQEFTLNDTDVNGCDSTTYFSLTINTPQNTTESPIACESYTWDVTGLTYTASDTYTADITDANGCAATATLNLTINNGEDIDVTETACDTYHWDITNQDYDQSGDYPVDFNDGNGCAYTATLHLTINQSQTVVLPAVTACDSYEFNGETYTASEEITVPGTGVNGCDSTTTLSLTINNAQTVALDAVTACESYEFNGQTYTASEEITVVGTGVNGCDSTTTLSLTINQPVTVALDAVTACGSYTWNGQTYTTSQTLTYTTTAANGCDSTTTVALTINTPVNTTATEVACDSYTWTVNGQVYTTSGTYTANIIDANGCDATATLNLTVNAAQNTTATEVACDSYTWTVNNQSYTTSGTYTANITDANGCAATATLNLTVNQSVTSTVALSDTGSVVFNDVVYTADTTVTVTFTAANGCDSTVTATITVIPEVFAPDSVTLVLSVNDTTLGMVVPAAGIYTYAANDTVELEATVFDGNHFTGWDMTYTLDGVTYTDNYDRAYHAMWFTMSVFNYYGIDTVYMVANFAEGPDSLTVVLGVNNDTMGTTNPVPGTYTYAANDTLNFFATANDGYQFVNWNIQYINGYGSVQTSTFTDDAVGLYASQLYYWGNDTIYIVANFEVDTNYTPIDTNTYYYITMISADTLMGTVAPSDSALANSRFTAYAIANEGYHFVNWTDENDAVVTTENPYIFTVTGDVTLVANFAVDSIPVIDTTYYTITVNYDATMGTVTGEGRYVEGTIVTLRATANAGYEFRGWVNGTDTVVRTPEYTFTLTSDVTLTAAFVALPVYYTVIGQVNDASMGEVLGSGQYVEGSTATLTAQAYAGFHFVNWSNGETTPTITFTVTEDVTVIAYFEADENPQAIDETDLTNVTIYSAETRIIVRGAEGETVNVYDINGRTIHTQAVAAETVEFRMAGTGVYLVKVGNAPAKRVLVVR